MNNRTKRIWIRVNESDEALFKEKSMYYSSVSAMIRQAVKFLHNESVTQRIERAKLLVDFYNRNDRNLQMMGVNLNQAIKTINEFAKTGLLTDKFVCDILPSRLTTLATSIADLKQQLRDLTRKSTRPIV